MPDTILEQRLVKSDPLSAFINKILFTNGLQLLLHNMFLYILEIHLLLNLLQKTFPNPPSRESWNWHSSV